MTNPVVAFCFCVGQLREEALHEVWEQWPEAVPTPQQPDDDFGYADDLRRLWRLPGDLVVIEQDVIPPPGAIRRLLDCDRLWCTHPHRVGSKHHTDTLGLVRFSRYLKALAPWLADVALAPLDHRMATRAGFTKVDPDANEATMSRYGRKSCIRQDAEVPAEWWSGWTRPSMVHWRVCDSHLARQLHGLLGEPHVHQPPTRHLHLY